jgi:heme exporter protein D
MQWNSFSDFIHMGGYGLYVWGSFGTCFITMLMELILVLNRQRNIQRKITEQDIGS